MCEKKFRSHGGIMSEPIVEFNISRSTLLSRNVTVSKRRTSIRLEPEMWDSLKDIARREGCSIHDVCTLVNLRKNARTSLTAAIRVFLMLYYRLAATEEGHRRAGHGNFQIMMVRAGLKASQDPRAQQDISNTAENQPKQAVRRRA